MNAHNHHYHYPIGKNRAVDYFELVIRQSINRGTLFNPIYLTFAMISYDCEQVGVIVDMTPSMPKYLQHQCNQEMVLAIFIYNISQ
jgi:hypothetical protein